MITCGAVPAPLAAHIGVSQISQLTTNQDFADPLGEEPTSHGGHTVKRAGR